MKETYKKITRKYNVDGKLIEEIEEVTEKEYKDDINHYFKFNQIPVKQEHKEWWNDITCQKGGVATFVCR